MTEKKLTIELETSEMQENAINDDLACAVEAIAKQIRDGYTAGQYWELTNAK